MTEGLLDRGRLTVTKTIFESRFQRIPELVLLGRVLGDRLSDKRRRRRGDRSIATRHQVQGEDGGQARRNGRHHRVPSRRELSVYFWLHLALVLLLRYTLDSLGAYCIDSKSLCSQAMSKLRVDLGSGMNFASSPSSRAFRLDLSGPP